MKQYKGDRLYVNLGPTQTKRRLKGHGFGVKKVQGDGRNRAVIIHTATGEHLAQLKRLFADVMPPSPLPPPELQTENPASESTGDGAR
jgi:DNA transformation protein and related proteins